MPLMKKLPALLVAFLCAVTLRAEDPATFEVAGLTFQRPGDWKWVAVTSPMRKAHLKVQGASEEQVARQTLRDMGYAKVEG